MMQKAQKFDPSVEHVVYAILSRHLASWWIDHGTLLGCVRDGNHLSWDTDVDIGCWFESDENIDQLMRAIRRTFPDAFFDPLACAVKIPFVTDSGKVWLFDIAFYKRRAADALKAWPDLPKFSDFQRLAYMWLIRYQQQVLGRRSRSAIGRAFWTLAVRVPMLGRSILPSNARAGMVRLLVRALRFPSRRNAAPARYFNGSSMRLLDGIQVPVPEDSEGYLEYRYGNDWRIEKRQWNYLTDDGGLL